MKKHPLPPHGANSIWPFSDLWMALISHGAVQNTSDIAENLSLAKKLDAFGIIICPVLALITAILSSVAIAIKSVSEIRNLPLNEAITKLGSLYDFNPDIASFVESHLISSILISAFASIIVCVFYFNRHPDEMYNSEIIVKKGLNNNKK